MSATQYGYLKLSRGLFDHEFWNEHREFSRAEAWIDLIQSARWKEGIGKQLVGGKMVTVDRGEVVTSLRFLMKKWGWKSIGKVLRFLELLQVEGMIEVDTDQGITVVNLVKYEEYNSNNALDVNEKRHENGTATEKKRNTQNADIQSDAINHGTQTEQQQVHKRNSNGTQTEQRRNKRKKERIINTPTSSSTTSETALQEWVAMVRADDIFTEQTRMKYKLTGPEFEMMLDRFVGDKKALGDLTHRDFKDFKRNFFFWIPKQPRSPATPAPTKKHPSLEVINPSKYDKYRTQ